MDHGSNVRPPSHLSAPFHSYTPIIRPLLKIMRQNVKLNDLSSRITVSELNWSAPHLCSRRRPVHLVVIQGLSNPDRHPPSTAGYRGRLRIF